MCIVAKGSRKIIKKLKINKQKLQQIAAILEVDEKLLSQGKLVGVELVYEETPQQPEKGGSSRAPRKAR
jgi:hypothetical protein